MGGTSFDVSIIYDGKPAYSFISNTDQYEYFLPKVDLQAIGAGGGSLVRVQPESRTMTVGPDSAGAFPGRSATGAAAPCRRSPMRSSCSATSTPTTSPAAA